ncbi:MAG: permease [Chloroflexota bacterium]
MRDKSAIILILVVLLLAVVLGLERGLAGIWEGLQSGGAVLWSVVPLLAAAFLVAGLTQVLVTEEFVKEWLGAASGWRGIALACLAGALIPGGPYVYYPITAVMLHNGAGLGVLVAFVAAKNLWSISRFPLEVALLGWELTLIRYAITLVIPPIFGALTQSLFGRHLETIRREAPRI